jgi:hypothetical protein
MAQTSLDRSSGDRTPPFRGVGSAAVTCSVCQGHLVADLYIDRVDAGGHVWIRALRCVGCGQIPETGRVGSGSRPQTGKSGSQRQGTLQKGMDDEMTALGT